MYKLGKVLKFNGEKWGFIDYTKGVLTVFSIKNKEKVTFKVGPSIFKKIYNNSIEEISQETIDFALKEEAQRKDILKQLKSGIKFIGSDNRVYTFLRLNNRKIEFYNEEGSFQANLNFIKTLTKEFDADYINHLDVVNTKKDYNALTDEEKVKIAINIFKNNYDDADTEYEILEIGNIISGEAYYHEVDDYYNLIGLQIKFKYKYDFQKEFDTEVGFFPIYIGRIKDFYPTVFQESFGDLDFNENTYYNGFGDKLVVDKILIEKDILVKYL